MTRMSNLRMMPIITSLVRVIPSVICIHLALSGIGYCSTLSDLVEEIDSSDVDSIWDSRPEEIYHAQIQILDKISGKVFRKIIKIGEPYRFGNMRMDLKRCFQNSPEDKNEIVAFVEIYENDNKIFANWLFASAPSVNLFEHPIYDVRVEF